MTQKVERRMADPKRTQHLFDMIDYDPLNDWETRFVSENADRFKRKGFVSSRVHDILEGIYQKQQEA